VRLLTQRCGWTAFCFAPFLLPLTALHKRASHIECPQELDAWSFGALDFSHIDAIFSSARSARTV
jgi:hypothetical protein